MIVLTPEQKKIVDFLGVPMCVLAGPGTGKTTCIAERIKYLIENRKIPHTEICAITFTNVAAAELREKLQSRNIKPDVFPYVNTLHGLAMGILKKHQKIAGLREGFRPIDNTLIRIMVKDVIQDISKKGIRVPRRDIKKYKAAYFQRKAGVALEKNIEKDKEMVITLDSFSESFNDHLDFYNVFDWPDILNKTMDIIDSNKEVRLEVTGKTRHLLVDEFQDLSHLEQKFVGKICGNIAGLCVAGDDDQSIYESFRFADPKGIVDFTKYYPSAQFFPITLCRRCPPAVIDCALALIRNNKVRKEKKLVPLNKDKKGFVIQRRNRSKKEEREWLVSKVIFLAKKGFGFDDIMILFTDGYTASDYLRDLKEAGVPLNIQLRTSHPFETIYFIGLISAIRWLVDNTDNLSLRYYLDWPAGLNSEATRQLRLLSLSSGTTLWDVVENIATNPKAFKAIKQRSKIIGVFNYFSALKSVDNYLDVLQKLEKDFPEIQKDEGCNTFFENLKRFKGHEEMVTLKEVLEDFEQNFEEGEIEKKQREDNKGVRVMTMHSAKGCESPVVIIPALEDDILPGNVINIEEKRRLFYVSITRTKYTVYLSWAGQRTGREIHSVGGRKMLDKIKSRFLDELETPMGSKE